MCVPDFGLPTLARIELQRGQSARFRAPGPTSRWKGFRTTICGPPGQDHAWDSTRRFAPTVAEFETSFARRPDAWRAYRALAKSSTTPWRKAWPGPGRSSANALSDGRWSARCGTLLELSLPLRARRLRTSRRLMQRDQVGGRGLSTDADQRRAAESDGARSPGRRSKTTQPAAEPSRLWTPGHDASGSARSRPRGPKAVASTKLFSIRGMQRAAQGQGFVEPNPMVGCVTTAAGMSWAKAHIGTWPRRRRRCGLPDRQTMYVTLEPCHGAGPACTGVCTTGVARVVAAVADPFPLGSGTPPDPPKAAFWKNAAVNAPYLKALFPRAGMGHHPWP